MTSMKPPDLASLQEQFTSVLLRQKSTVSDELPLSALSQSRLSYYRGNLNAIWYAALKNVYPVLHKLVGDDFFRQMAREYGETCPSGSGDLNQFGAELPSYLDISESCSDYPYFVDVARLEWQLHCSYYAANVTVLRLSELITSAASRSLDLSSVILQKHPAVSLYASSRCGLDIWLAHQQPGPVIFPSQTDMQNYGLIVRPDWKPKAIRLQKTEWMVLSKLFLGECLENALDYALRQEQEFPIQASLNRWFQLEIFSAIVSFCDEE